MRDKINTKRFRESVFKGKKFIYNFVKNMTEKVISDKVYITAWTLSQITCGV